MADTHLDHRADLYALGALAYELLTGRPPFAGRSPQAAMAAHVAVTPEPIAELRPTVPASLASLVMRCLEKKPADRWQRAEDLLPHLDALVTPSGGVTPTQAVPVMGVRGRRKRGVRSWAVTVGGLVLVVVVGALVLRGAFAPKEEGPGAGALEDAPVRLVVVPPEDRTGDPAAADWGFMAAEVVTRALDRAMVVAVVPASAVRDRVREVDLSAGMPVDELARRTGARYAVAGSYTVSAGRVRFDAELTDAVSGDLLRAIDPVAGPVDSLEAVLALLAERVAAVTTATLSPDVNPGLGRWSNPPDLEALRSLLAVQDLFCRRRYPEAIERARPALEAAPDFAALALTVIIAQSNLGRNREADSLLTALEPLRDRLTLSERLLAEWMHGNIHGDRAEATRAVERLFRLQPGHWGYQAAWTATQANRHADALERFLAWDLDTPCTRVWTPWWTFLAQTYHMLGRHEEQLDIARRGLERFPDHAALTYWETVALVALGRMAEADSVLEVLEGMPVPPGNSPGLQPAFVALELRIHGYREKYEAVMDRVLAWFTARPAGELRYQRGRAFYYAERWSDADTLFAALVAESPESLDYRGHRGVTLAHLGRREEAMEVSRWFEALTRPYMNGADTRWRAAIAAALGDRDGAVTLLEQAFEEGMALGYYHQRDPEWETLRDHPRYRALVAPRD